MKLTIIKILDWIDDKIIGHRIYWICYWIGSSDWWDAPATPPEIIEETEEES